MCVIRTHKEIGLWVVRQITIDCVQARETREADYIAFVKYHV